jgi:hypothetical protein
VDRPSDEELTGLRRVVAHRLVFSDGSLPMCVAYSLRFREAVLLIEVDPDTDSIVLTVGSGPELQFTDGDLPVPLDLTTEAPWATVRGALAGWRWLLTNQQGFTDGFQLELVTDGGSTTFQWMAEASQLRCVQVPD